MPAIDVDREQVKMLALTMGVREAARQMGLNENTVLAWAHKGSWFADFRPKPPLKPLPKSLMPITTIKKPSDAFAEALADESKKTRLHLSRAALRAAEDAAECKNPLENAPLALQAGKLAALVHRWEGSEGSTTLNLAFFDSDNGRAADLPSEGPVIDISEDAVGPMDDPMF